MMLENFLKRVAAICLLVVFVLGGATYAKNVSSDNFKVKVRIIQKSGLAYDKEVSFEKVSFINSAGKNVEVGKTALGALAYALGDSGLGYSIEEYSSSGGNKTYYVKSVGQDKNWLYAVNGWTPFCRASNDFILKSGDEVDFYEISYQGLPYPRMSLSQNSFKEGDNNFLSIEKRQSGSGCSDLGNLGSWQKASGVSVYIQDNKGGKKFFRSDFLGRVDLSLFREGKYEAWVEDNNYFPSNKIYFSVSAQNNVGGDKGEPEKSIGRVDNNFQVDKNISLNDKVVLEKDSLNFGKKENKDLSLGDVGQNGPIVLNVKSESGSRLDSYRHLTLETSSQDANFDYSSFGSGLEMNYGSESSKSGEGVVLQQIDLEKAIQFILSQQDESGNIGGESFSPWALMALYNQEKISLPESQKLITALSENISENNNMSVLDLEKNILALSSFKIDVGNVSGKNLEKMFFDSFSDGQIGEKDKLNDDIWGLVTLRILGFDETDERVRDQIEYLKSYQKSSGGFSFMVDGKEDVDDTVFTLLALKMSGVSLSDPVFLKGFQYIESHRNGDGGYYSFEKGKSSGTTSLLVFLLKDELGKEVPYSLIDFIYSLQQENGSFLEYRDEEINPLFTTTFAVLALSGNGYPFRVIKEEGILEEVELEDLNKGKEDVLEGAIFYDEASSKDDLIFELIEENRRMFERFERLVKYLLISVLSFEVVVFLVLVYFVTRSLKNLKR